MYGIDLDGFSPSNGEIESGINMVLNNPMTITTSGVITNGNAYVACNMYAHLLHDVLIRIGSDGKVTKSS